jgi:hypothetical protein
MKDTFLILLIVALLIGAGWVAGIGAVVNHDSWSPRAYVPARPGDCFVAPQGDPLYDQHYAQQVNTYNCQALKDQSSAHFIDAQTNAVQVETQQSQLGVYSIFFVVVATLVLLAIAMIKGG